MIVIGKIVRTVGLKGFVRFYPYAEKTSIQEDVTVWIQEKPYEVQDIQVQKNMLNVRLKGFDTIESAEKLVGYEVFMEKEDIELEDDEFLFVDLIGLTVKSTEGEVIGTVSDILERSYQDILVVGDTLIPFVDEFIKKVDLEEKCITVQVIEGLL
ncbi:ribosome maturation factor RimM [Guggenheimella bovis]